MSFLDRIRSLAGLAPKVSPGPAPAPARSGTGAGRKVPVRPDPGADAYFADEGNWQSVSSSNVEAVALYIDLADRRNTLGVRFRPEGAARTSEYRFYGVPLSLYTGYLASNSKGRFHWAAVRDRYDYARVR